MLFEQALLDGVDARLQRRDLPLEVVEAALEDFSPPGLVGASSQTGNRVVSSAIVRERK